MEIPHSVTSITLRNIRRERLEQEGKELCEFCDVAFYIDDLFYDFDGIPMCPYCLYGVEDDG